MTQESPPTPRNSNVRDAEDGSEPVTRIGSHSEAESTSTVVDSGKIRAIAPSTPKQMRHEDFMLKKAKDELRKAKRKSPSTGTDMVNSPPHYNQSDIECIDAILAATSDSEVKVDGGEAYLQGNIIKYLWRYRYKEHPVQDLMKARWYLDKLIERVRN